MKIVMTALANGQKNDAAGIVVVVFIFLYSPLYNVGNNALAYTYLVELFPYAKRSRGVAVEQFFVRGAGFFTTFVNPIGMVCTSRVFSVQSKIQLTVSYRTMQAGSKFSPSLKIPELHGVVRLIYSSTNTPM